MTVSRREYLGDIASLGEDYQVRTWVITPTNQDLFPWLSTIAAHYEEYSFNGIHLEFKPSVPTSTPGMIGMAAEFDAMDATPVSKAQFLNVVPSARSSVFAGHSMAIQRRDLNVIGKKKFTGDAASNLQLLAEAQTDSSHTRFAGRVYTMFQGVPAGDVGEIWVTYSVDLCVPDYAPTCNLPAPGFISKTTISTSWTPNRLWDNNTPTTNPVVVHQELIGVEFGNTVGAGTNYNQLNFTDPDKYYRIRMRIRFDSGGRVLLTGSCPTLSSGAVGHFVTRYNGLVDTATLAAAEAVQYTFYVKTFPVNIGGPIPADPYILRFAPGIQLDAGAFIDEFAMTITPITESDYNSRDILRDPDMKTKPTITPVPFLKQLWRPKPTPQPAPEAKAPDDAILRDLSPPIDPPRSGWVMARASQVLGYPGDSGASTPR